MALSAAIILAAGEGTRMRSNKPKVLHTLAGKTFLNRVMDSVSALDPETLAVVVHYQAERVAEAARSYNERVTIVNQDDIPGTGRAVQCAMTQLKEQGGLDGSVLIAASDMPLLDADTLNQLLAFHEQSGNGAPCSPPFLTILLAMVASSATAKATCCASWNRRTPTAANWPCMK